MADAEDLPGQGTVAASHRHAPPAQGLVQLGPTPPLGHPGRGDRGGTDLLPAREEGHAHLLQALAAEGGHLPVTGENGLQPFVQQGLGGHLQAGHGVPVVGVGEEALLQGRAPGGQGVVAGVAHRLHYLPGPGTDGHHGQIRQEAQHLLAAQEAQVDVPVVHPDLHTPTAGHEVHVEEGVHLLADGPQLSQGGEGAAGRLAVDRGDELGAELQGRGPHLVRVGHIVVVKAHYPDLGPHLLGHLADAVAEDAVGHGQHPIPGPEDALQRAPEGQHPLAGLDGDLVLRGQDLLEQALTAGVELEEFLLQIGAAVVALVDGQDLRGDGHRAGHQTDLVAFHGSSP